MRDICSLIRGAADPEARPDDRLEAFSQIVRRFQDMVYGCAYAILGDAHRAEDAAQETFLAAYRKLDQLRRPEAFASWLRRIVITQCGRMTRGRHRAGQPLESVAEPASGEPTPAEVAERRELTDRVTAALRSLPEPQRMPLTLYYINGYTQKEVAEFLDVPVGTVKSRLHNSRRRLKERMLHMVAEELHNSKPGAGFVDRVRGLILLIEDGRRMAAFRLQESILGKLKALQKDGYYEAVVSEHKAAMKAIEANASVPGMWRETYGLLGESYIKAGRGREMADAILSSIPRKPSGEEVSLWVGKAMCDAIHALHRAGESGRAEIQGKRLIEMLNEMFGHVAIEQPRDVQDVIGAGGAFVGVVVFDGGDLFGLQLFGRFLFVLIRRNPTDREGPPDLVALRLEIQCVLTLVAAGQCDRAGDGENCDQTDCCE